MRRPGRILERDEVATPRGSPVTLSKGVLPGIVHFRSDLKELRPSFGSRCQKTSITLPRFALSLPVFTVAVFRLRHAQGTGAHILRLGRTDPGLAKSLGDAHKTARVLKITIKEIPNATSDCLPFHSHKNSGAIGL